MSEKKQDSVLPVRFKFIIIFAAGLLLVAFIVYMLRTSLDDVVPSVSDNDKSSSSVSDSDSSSNQDNVITTKSGSDDSVHVMTKVTTVTTGNNSTDSDDSLL